MLVIGLTGGIGSGKSTVADLFQQLGIPVIDTDLVARQLVEPGQPAYSEIITSFDSILTTDGHIDRHRLRDVVFNQPEKRLKLEAILHPRIQQQAKQILATLNNDYVIIVVPLLTENGKWPFIDRVLVVDCDPRLQVERASKRDTTDAEQIKKIIQVQATRQQRLAIADDCILNENDLNELKIQVKALDEKFRQLAKDIKH